MAPGTRALRGAGRLPVLVGVTIAVLGLAWFLWDRPIPVAIDGRRDMLADAAHVEFLEGFEGRTEFEVWNAVTGLNPDRDELAVLFPRRGRLRWYVPARPGARFVAKLGRRQMGPSEDRTPCAVSVRVIELPDGSPATELPSVEVPLPAIGENPGVGPDALRESTLRDLELALPDGAALIEIETTSPDGMAAGSLALLLSPRLLQPPREVDLREHTTIVPDGERLLHRFARDDRKVDFALRIDDRGGETTVKLPLVEPVGSFTGKHARPALALLARPAAQPKVEVTIHRDTVFRCALALDDRMPSGTSVDLQLLINDRVAAVERIDSTAWREVVVPLGEWAGTHVRVLQVRLDNTRLEPDSVPRTDIDFTRGDRVRVFYRAKVVRAGLANPRLVRERAVPRRPATAKRPSVIVLHAETLRADVLPMYGGEQTGLTPRLDALAPRAVIWDSAFAPSPWTLPSTVTLFTGLLPTAHGAVDHDRVAMPTDVTTLAEHIRAAGAATGAFASNDLLLPRKGFGWGFEEYGHIPYANARQVNDLARGFIEDHAGQQFFLFLHYFDPHHPFNAPGDHRLRYVEPELVNLGIAGAPIRLNNRLRKGETIPRDDPDVRMMYQRYLGEIEWFDSQVGALIDLLEELELAENTVVLFTADHGEEFMDHGLHGHGSQLFDEALHVPLVGYAPGGQLGPPRRVEGVRSTVGLFDTVLEVMDVEHDSTVFETSLLDEPAQRFAFSETNKGIVLSGGGDPLRRWITSVRTDDHLLIARHPAEGADETELSMYDLRLDPEAQRPLPIAGPTGRRLQEHLSRALNWSKQHLTGKLAAGGDSQVLDAIEQLGYVESESDDAGVEDTEAPPEGGGTEGRSGSDPDRDDSDRDDAEPGKSGDDSSAPGASADDDAGHADGEADAPGTDGSAHAGSDEPR